MISPLEQYSELVALTQLFLLREHEVETKQVAEVETYNFFKAYVEAAPSSIRQKQIAIEPQPIPPSPDPIPPQPKPEPIKEPPKPVIPQPDPTPKPAIPEPAPDPVIPEPKPNPIIQRASAKAPLFTLELPIETKVIDCQEFKPILQKHFSHYSIKDQIPSDAQAKRHKNLWQAEQIIPPIIILSFQEQEKQLLFLKNVAEAISKHLAPARVLSGIKIEQDKKWNDILKSAQLKLVIASDYGLYLLPELMKHYKETPKQAKHFLNQTPLLLLSDLSLYLKQPQLKPLLWRAICTEFAASRAP